MARRKKHGRTPGIWSVLNKVLPAIAFISQATKKEKASYATLPTVDKLKAMTNNILGNAFGLNIFGGTTPQFTEKFNPAGIANKYTGVGIAGIGLKYLNKRIKVPYLGRISSLAIKFLVPGVLGGIIDAPDDTTTYNYFSAVNTAPYVSNVSYDSTRLSS